MAVFVYRARDPGGTLVRGRATADTERDLIQRLRSQGLLVLGVKPSRDLEVLLHNRAAFFRGRIKPTDLALFVRQFATMVNGGLPILAALKVVIRQSTNTRLRQILSDVAADVEAGESLAAAFGKREHAFPDVVVQMIAAGEIGGFLGDVLDRIANHLEREEHVRHKVRSAMVYPMVVACVAVLVVAALMVFVVPRFIEVYADLGTDLPLITRILLWTSHLVEGYWWAFLASIIGLLVAFRYALRSEATGLLWDRLALKLPIFGPIVTKRAVARFARTLSGLLSSGINILKALTVVERTVGNRVFAGAITTALESVRQGQLLASPLRHSGVFPPMVVEMVSVGEETGALEEMLNKAADYYEDEVYRSAEQLSASLEPILIVGIGATVGLIVVSIMLPVFNLWSSF